MALRLSLADQAVDLAPGVPQPPGWYPVAKRVFDAALALVGLILTAPLWAAIAVAIAAESRGPIVFRQVRVGEGGRAFVLFKFRTMVANAEVQLAAMPQYMTRKEPVFKLKDDPRVTRVGRVLRRLSLDELPQLINVFRGEMSLVGPRPALPSEVAQYAPRHRRRLAVPPGVTGLWQVSGRSDLPFEQWVALDLEYIERRSLWLDLRILLRTIPTVLSGDGAY